MGIVQSLPMTRRHVRLPFLALFDQLKALKPDADAKLADEADLLEAAHGEQALELIRARIAQADRAARKQLYRLHDELARRRRDYADMVALETAA